MTKVHPKTPADRPAATPPVSDEPSVLTVWCKSLLFNCRGFTVFDPKGNLLFRIDNYASSNAAETTLMDAIGNPVLTIRRRGIGPRERWMVYNGAGAEGAAAMFTVRKRKGLVPGKTVAHVEGDGWGHVVEGCYRKRSCAVYERRKREVVAEVRRKEGAGGVRFGDDVFKLVVGVRADAAAVMAIVVVLGQMYGSR